jgi:hypothetical protein
LRGFLSILSRLLNVEEEISIGKGLGAREGIEILKEFDLRNRK